MMLNKPIRHLFTALLCLGTLYSSAQVSCDPVFPNPSDDVTIFYDATLGNAALVGVNPVFIHTGVITNLSTTPSDWKYVKTTWAVSNTASQMTNVSTNIWKKSININQFYGVPAGETILKLAFVFRNGTGSLVGRGADGGDMYYDVYPENGPMQTLFLSPTQSVFLKNIGEQIPVKAAASVSADLKLYDNGQQIATATGVELNSTLSVTTVGLHKIEVVATATNEADTASFIYLVPEVLPAQDPPTGTGPGITYLDNTSVRLSLYAPNKQIIYAIGDFNNWIPNPAYQLRKSLDGNTWWIDITGLTPGQSVRFQYLVDGTLKIADPLSTLVLDPWNDAFISPLTYPNMPLYPSGKTTGMVSLIETGQTPFNWTATNYVRPEKKDLVVYELLMRDFLARHDYPTLLDTLDYLEKMGINAIELMPVNEFDGNINWGYGPAYHKALDKYYGDPASFKTFIDECHHRNIAVILDVVFNHATGASPLAQLYWDSANNRPAADNPWLNPIAKHDFNVFNDFNHESVPTKVYVRNCLQYWLSEYKVDGFRFDLSKGFTQKNTLGNTGAWGAYDATRIAIIKDYTNTMWAIDPTAYSILEHFADNTEEKELAQFGTMIWGNMWGSYKDVALGFSSATAASLAGINYKQRTWTVPHLIGYMESHDENRIGFECKEFGNSAVVDYNIKSLPVAMRRLELANALFYTVPGPKMLWQFGEMGYDFPINYCENGTVNPDCRTAPKPIRWDFLENPYRKRLQNMITALIQLRTNNPVFSTTDYQLSIGSGAVKSLRLNSPNMNVHVLTNVTTSNQNATANFQHTGTWFEYFTGATLEVTMTNMSIPLKRGEYRLYTDNFVALPDGITFTSSTEPTGNVSMMTVYPNPGTTEVYVDFSMDQQANIQMDMTDIAGRIIETRSFDRISGDQQVLWNIAALPSGCYFMTIRDANGQSVTRKLMKQ